MSLTSPFLTVIDWRRGVVSSFMLDKKFWEIRKASCRRGWSGWLVGVCLSKSYRTEVEEEILTFERPALGICIVCTQMCILYIHYSIVHITIGHYSMLFFFFHLIWLLHFHRCNKLMVKLSIKTVINSKLPSSLKLSPLKVQNT